MSYRLPDQLHSWIWTGRFLALGEDEVQTTPGGIILPNQQVDDRDAMVHYSMLLEGKERSWLWLFPKPQEAVALRLIPDFVSGADATLIQQTLPQASPGEAEPCLLMKVPVDWLMAALPPNEIQEVWLGFNWKRYSQDRNLRASADYVFPSTEFKAIAAR